MVVDGQYLCNGAGLMIDAEKFFVFPVVIYSVSVAPNATRST